MPTFVEADRDYRAAIEAPGRKLADALASAHAAGPVNLKDTDLTHAVLLRLKSFFATQDEIKRSLQKVYAGRRFLCRNGVLFFSRLHLGILIHH